MDTVQIARKLEPLMPKEVRHWLHVRETGDAELRGLIDRQIATNAHRVLGDFRNKILLSLPPARMAAGTFNLGTIVYDKFRHAFGISDHELLQNLAIFGRSGAGKTNLAFHLLLQLRAKGVPFLFLDWKRTARHLLSKIMGKVNVFTPGRSLSPFPFNPFIPPPGMEPNVYANHVIDVLSNAYSLGDGARSILERALGACYAKRLNAPKIDDVLHEVEQISAVDRARGWKLSAVRALESLAFSKLAASNSLSQQRLVQTLLHENTIIELDALAEGGKKFLIPLLCLWLYYVRLAARERERLRLAIFVEEAHHVLFGAQRSRESLMNMLLRQCREIGMAMIIVDQHPHLVSSAALGNTFTSICLNLKNPADINKAAAISMIQESENKRYFSMLSVGQAIVKMQNRWRWPFLIQIPHVHVDKGSVSDSALLAYLRQNSTRSGRNPPLVQRNERVQHIPHEVHPLGELELAFLKDVLEHPEDGVRTRYKRLGLSAGRGQRIKDHLLDQRWLEAETIPIGRTRKMMLRPTSQARKLLDVSSDERPHGSIAHEYWKQFYARKFSAEGYRVQLEAPRDGGRVDVLALRNGERVAIEIETGKSDVIANVRNCLRSGFERVIVVATDDEALGKVERELATAGLIVPGRVRIVSRKHSVEYQEGS